MNISSLFRLNGKDFARGAITAVITALVAFIYKGSQSPDFSIFALDWNAILNAGFYGLIGYLGKNFLSDDSGKFMGKI